MNLLVKKMGKILLYPKTYIVITVLAFLELVNLHRYCCQRHFQNEFPYMVPPLCIFLVVVHHRCPLRRGLSLATSTNLLTWNLASFLYI